MKSRKSLLFVLLAMMLFVVLAACSTAAPAEEAEQPEAVEPTAEAVMEDPTEVPMEEEMPGTIVDIAVADGRFTTLVTAVTEAGLAETLSGEGPFTGTALGGEPGETGLITGIPGISVGPFEQIGPHGPGEQVIQDVLRLQGLDVGDQVDAAADSSESSRVTEWASWPSRARRWSSR